MEHRNIRNLLGSQGLPSHMSAAIQNPKLDSRNSKHVTEGMGGEVKQLPFHRIIRAPMSKMV